MSESDEKFNTLLMLEIATDDKCVISERFPAEGACLCHYAPIVTLDRERFGGREGGLAQELVTLIGWALSGKEEYSHEELFI